MIFDNPYYVIMVISFGGGLFLGWLFWSNLAQNDDDSCMAESLSKLTLAMQEMEKRLMAKLTEYGEKVNAAFDEIATAVDGVVVDVDFLKAEIKKLQDNPGPISPEDQKILDGIQARADQLAAKAKALNEATETPPEPEPA